MGEVRMWPEFHYIVVPSSLKVNSQASVLLRHRFALTRLPNCCSRVLLLARLMCLSKQDIDQHFLGRVNGHGSFFTTQYQLIPEHKQTRKRESQTWVTTIVKRRRRRRLGTVCVCECVCGLCVRDVDARRDATHTKCSTNARGRNFDSFCDFAPPNTRPPFRRV